MKRFMYASIGILALAAAFHFGASSAQSQNAKEIVAAFTVDNRAYIVTSTGDIHRDLDHDGIYLRWGNVWSKKKARFQ